MRLASVAVLAVLVTCGCSIEVKYPPPMRRHVDPMLPGKVAVLKPRVPSEDGSVEYDGPVTGHEISNYDLTLAQGMATATELTGIFEKCDVVPVSSQNFMTWRQSPAAKAYQYMIVSELVEWEAAGDLPQLTYLNPASLLSAFGLPTISITYKTHCALNVQVIELATGKSIMMLTPSTSFEKPETSNFYTFTGIEEDYFAAVTIRLIEELRVGVESRAMLYAADRTIAPYDFHSARLTAEANR